MAHPTFCRPSLRHIVLGSVFGNTHNSVGSLTPLAYVVWVYSGAIIGVMHRRVPEYAAFREQWGRNEKTQHH